MAASEEAIFAGPVGSSPPNWPTFSPRPTLNFLFGDDLDGTTACASYGQLLFRRHKPTS